MSEKRRDSKGRILRTGESQRKDGLYQFRYTDVHGKRQTIYDSDLKLLRDKEKEIQRKTDEGIDYAAGKATVNDILARYLEIKRGKIRPSTLATYEWVVQKISENNLGSRPIGSVKPSDMILWVNELKKQGHGYRSIEMMRSVAKCAFQIACDEAVIRKNPCDFKLSSVIANDAKRRVALTREMCDEFSRFLRNDNIYRKYYDIVVVLLGTGMRISELCGLTINDLDFSKRRIRVERQLIRRAKKNADKPAYIEKPKSNSGFRFIPMSDEVYDSLRKTVERRSKLDDEAEIDGCRGFVFTNKRSAPYYAGVLQVAIKNASTKYVSRHPGTEMPIITPHVLRHTFCTNMVQRGLDIKSLQYIMGHSDTSTTLNVYAHAQYDHVAESFERIMNP